MVKKPEQVTTAGALLLASGIMSLLVNLGIMLGSLFIWCTYLYGIPSAIYAIVKGAQLLSGDAYGRGVPKVAAGLQIGQIVSFDLIGMGCGIAALVMLNDPDVTAYLEGRTLPTNPGAGYGGQPGTWNAQGAQAPPQSMAQAPPGYAAPQAPGAAPSWGASSAPPAAPPSAAPPAWGGGGPSTPSAPPAGPGNDPWGGSPGAQGGASGAPVAAADPWAPPPPRPGNDPWGGAPGARAEPAAGAKGYDIAPWGSSSQPPTSEPPRGRHTVVEQAVDPSKPPAESSVSSKSGWGSGWGSGGDDSGNG